MGFHPFAGDEAPMAAVNSGRGILENPFMAGKSQFEAVCVWCFKDPLQDGDKIWCLKII